MAKGKKRPAELPEYGTVMMKGVVLPHPDYRCRRKESCDLWADTRRIV